MVAAGLLLTLSGLAVLGWWMQSGASAVVVPTDPRTTVDYQGSIDLRIWRTTPDQKPRRLRLTEPGALPLHPGDQFRIEVQVQPAGYVYLFWIDTEGGVVPVFPWEAGKWGARNAPEEPTDRLELPERTNGGYTIVGDQEGMETLVMVVRSEPLPIEEAALRRSLSNLPAQRPVQNPLAAVWFENGQVVENDPKRVRASFEVRDVNDPVLRLQDLLRRKLQALGPFTSAVSFARLGK
jgi:hypothetical protein